MAYKSVKRLVEKEVDFLRKACFKYKRRKFINNGILIHFVEALADKKSEYVPICFENKYLHIILIDKGIINNRNVLLDNIRYQLIRAFCAEYFSELNSFTNVSDNDSEVFLSMLQFINKGENNCYLKHINNNLHQIMQRVNTFDELQLELAFFYYK